MKPRFSIVMPAYNAEEYIRIMIQSIIDQTFQDWHLIIINDGSTDDTPKICDKYVCDRIEVHHISNHGQVYARCRGIEKAEGEYTLVVDADDYLTPDCLERVNSIISEKKYDIVMFPYMCCDEKLHEEGETSASPSIIGEMNQKDIIKWVIGTCNHGLCNKVIKTDIVRDSISEVIERKLSVNGDYALIIPILCRVQSGYFVNKSFYLYRVYNSSISHRYSYDHIADTDFVSGYVIDYLARHDLLDGEIKKLVYVSYIKMIVVRLKRIICNGSLTIEQFNAIKEFKIFRNSYVYENEIDLTNSEYEILTFFRKGTYNERRLLQYKLILDVARTKGKTLAHMCSSRKWK